MFENANDLPLAVDDQAVTGASRRFIANYAAVPIGSSVTSLRSVGNRIGDLAAPSAASAPTLRYANGRTYLEFDGVDDVLTCSVSDAAAIGVGAFTTYTVGRYRTANTNGAYWPLTNHHSESNNFGITSYNTGTLMYRGTVSASAYTLDTNWHVFFGVFNGTSSLMKRDSATPVSVNPGGLTIGTLSLGGGAGSTATKPPLDIAEMGMFDRALTVAELAALSSQLMATYNIV
ncbi:hypothetical protein [Clavibacter capsici]|uniref:hypothetical protein n=1 Tax=Clavibacter capsici TaxID=1874630 RepID=UPI00287B8BC6|nr:hypothetical protein [Clavibacter capsici]